jgi:hypothetical protein
MRAQQEKSSPFIEKFVRNSKKEKIKGKVGR